MKRQAKRAPCSSACCAANEADRACVSAPMNITGMFQSVPIREMLAVRHVPRTHASQGPPETNKPATHCSHLKSDSPTHSCPLLWNLCFPLSSTMSSSQPGGAEAGPSGRAAEIDTQAKPSAHPTSDSAARGGPEVVQVARPTSSPCVPLIDTLTSPPHSFDSHVSGPGSTFLGGAETLSICGGAVVHTCNGCGSPAVRWSVAIGLPALTILSAVVSNVLFAFSAAKSASFDQLQAAGARAQCCTRLCSQHNAPPNAHPPQL